MINVISYYSLLLLVLSSSAAFAHLGMTSDQLEASNGKPVITKKLNGDVNLVVYPKDNGTAQYFLFKDKAELYGVCRSSKSLSSDVVKDILEKNKSGEGSFWELAKETESGPVKVYYLRRGDGRVATWLDDKIIIASKKGLAYMKNNKDEFNQALIELKDWATGLVQKRTDGTSDEMLPDVIEIGIVDQKKAVLYAEEKRSKGNKAYSFPYLFGRIWYKNNPKDYMQWARTLTSAEFEEANKCTYDIVNDIDNTATESYVVKEMPRGSKRNLALFTIGFKKSQSNPLGAIQWADSFSPDDSGYLPVVSSVAVFSAKKKPDEVLDWVISISDKIPDYESEDKPCSAILIPLNEVYKKDPSRALTKALDIKNEKNKAVECFRLAKLLSEKDLDEFMRFLCTVNKKEDKNLFYKGFYAAFSNGTFNDNKKIAVYLIKNDISPFEEDPRNAGLYTAFIPLFRKWYKENPNECIDFIKSIKTNTERGAILKTHVLTSFMGGEDPYSNINKSSSGQ